MDIDPHIATTIVENISGAFGHDINFFNTDGTMIASTDRTRIGTHHEAAWLAARTGRIVAVDADHPFRGARDGINVPVMQSDAVIAVIGITGRREDVEPFGTVLRRMTEILVRESLDQVTRFDRRMMVFNLTNMLIAPQPDAATIGYLAGMLGVDASAPRRAAVGRVRATTPLTASMAEQLRTIVCRELAVRPQTLFSAMGDEYRLLIDVDDMKDAEGSDDPAARLVGHVRDVVGDELGLRMDFALGDPATGPEGCRRSYGQACAALRWTTFTGGGGIGAYDELGYGLAIGSIGREEAARFVDAVFAGLGAKEVDEARAVFDAYTRHNGSIGRTADELFLHKNTVQNRLNAIARKTGYNPRDLRDYAALSTAFTLRDLLAFDAGRRA